MGSTFGKVRKYNLNPVEEPAPPFKYTPLPDNGASAPHPPPPPSQDDILRPRRPTPRERARQKDPQPKRSNEMVDFYTVGYPPQIHPEYYGFHVDEELLIPPKYAHHYVKTGNQPREYKSPHKVRQPPPVTPQPPSPPPPPLPPRNSATKFEPPPKPDTASDPNPRPPQKFYSADDINKLLKPLNCGSPQWNFSTSREEPLSPPRYNTLQHPPSRVSEHHRVPQTHYHTEYQWGTPLQPQPNRFTTSNNEHRHQEEIRSTYNPPPKYYYVAVNQNHRHNKTTQNQFKIPPSEFKYNTIPHVGHVKHPYNEYKTNTSIRAAAPPRSSSNFHPDLSRSGTAQPLRQYNTHQQTSANPTTPTTTGGVKDQQIQHPVRPKLDTLYQPGILSPPQLDNEDPPPYPTGLYPHHCYTIPEEGSWLPPFHYNPHLHPIYRSGFRQ